MPASRPLGALARARQTAWLLGLNQVERTVPWWPRERLERVQRRRVRAAVEHAYTHVPFYRRALDELGATPADFTRVQDLERLPLIDGRDLAAAPDDLTATPYLRTGREVFSTSGSTSGIRKRICWDHPSLMRRFARGERDRTVIVGLAGERWTANMLRELTTRDGRYRVTWIAAGAFVPVNEHFELDVTVARADEARTPVTGATVEAPLLHAADAIVCVGLDAVELIPAAWPYAAHLSGSP